MKPSQAELQSLQRSVSNALANGASSFCRTYRCKHTADAAALIFVGTNFLCTTVAIRDGSAVLAVDMCENFPDLQQ